MRHLRTYERVADRTHWCDVCCEFIYPGEMYSGMVYVNESRDKYRLVVFKKHASPSCEPPPDLSDEERNISSNGMEIQLGIAA